MQRYEEWADAIIGKIRKKMEWVSEKNKNKIPYRTDENGDYDDRSDPFREWRIDDGLNWWTNGFWGGIMWLLYQDTGEERYARIARVSEKKMEQCFQDFYGLHHDVGFMFVPTAVADYRLTGSPDSRRIAMHAANLLAGRFNPVGKFIRAWNDLEEDTRGWAIIDCMFNLSLLYWASEETGDPRFSQIAVSHADTAGKSFIRGDGSSNHIVEFDLETGEMVKSYGGQGFGEGSSWTRGQSWALYGFTLSHLHTKDPAYLATAERVANYFIANIPESGFIPVDFRQPVDVALEDSTAAAIASCGLIELAKLKEGRQSRIYLSAALKMLGALAEERVRWNEEEDNLLEKCTAAYHDQEHEFSIIYGDYYFLEALMKLNGRELFIW